MFSPRLYATGRSTSCLVAASTKPGQLVCTEAAVASLARRERQQLAEDGTAGRNTQKTRRLAGYSAVSWGRKSRPAPPPPRWRSRAPLSTGPGGAPVVGDWNLGGRSYRTLSGSKDPLSCPTTSAKLLQLARMAASFCCGGEPLATAERQVGGESAGRVASRANWVAAAPHDASQPQMSNAASQMNGGLGKGLFRVGCFAWISARRLN